MIALFLAFTLGCCLPFAYTKIGSVFRKKYGTVRVVATITTEKEKNV